MSNLRDEVGMMIEQVNALLDEHRYDEAYDITNRMLGQHGPVAVDPNVKPEVIAAWGFIDHYCALVILYANRYFLACRSGKYGEEKRDCLDEWQVWLDRIDVGHELARAAATLLPEYAPAQGVLADYDSIPAEYRTP